jgi:tetratricopeptide (TPR) repeat protein
MRHERTRRTGTTLALCTFVLAAPGLAQLREYYVRGRVLDTQKQPIPGVEIRLSDASTSRSFGVKTDKQGVYKLAGLPHGLYQASFVKEGYATKRDEWRFETPQDTMQRVEVPDVVLVSESQIQQAQHLEQAAAEVKQASEALQNGDPEGALALLRSVLSKNPKDPKALFLMGLSYDRKKMHHEAVAALIQVTELSPSFAGAHFELGVCYRQLGDLPKALASYERTLELDASNMLAAYNSGLILFEANRIDEALARFEQALALKPGDADVLEMAGRCYIHQGKFQTAVERLERARAASSDPAKVASLDELVRMARTQMK